MLPRPEPAELPRDDVRMDRVFQLRARSLRAAASASSAIRAVRVSGRRATATQASSILRAEGGNAAKLAAAGGRTNDEDKRRKQLKEFVNSLLQSVSNEDRILLMLKEVEGLSIKELEQVYGVKENALKVRLFRARQRVLKSLGDTEK